MFQILRVLSYDPETKWDPSGENPTDITYDLCPSKTALHLRVFASYNMIVLSDEPDAKSLPFLE